MRKIILSLTVLFMQFYLASSLLTFILSFSLISLYIRKKWGFDIILSSFISFCVLIVAVVCLTNIVALLGWGNLFYIFTYALASLSSFVLYSLLQVRNQSIKRINWVSVDSLISLGIFVMVLVFFIYVPFMNPATAHFISFLSPGEDNISHFSLMHFIYRYATPAYGHSVGIWSGLANYPQGMHAFFAFLADGVSHYVTMTNGRLLRFYYLSESLVSSVFIFFWVKTALSIIGRISVRNTIFFLLLFCLLFMGVVAPLVVNGYFAQLGAFMFFAVTASALTQNKTRINNIELYLVTLGFLGVIVTWYLGALLFVPLLLYLTYRSSASQKKIIFLMLPLLAVACITPIFHIFMGGSAVAITSTAKEPFGISLFFYAILLFVLIVSIITKESLKYLPLFVLFAGSVGVLVIFGSIQFSLDHTLNYFFYKLLVMIIPLSLLWTIPLFENKRQQLINFMLVVLVSSGVTPIYERNYNAFVAPFYTNNSFKAFPFPSDIQALVDGNTAYNDGVYIANCALVPQYFINRWIGAMMLTQSDSRRNLELAALTSGIHKSEWNEYSAQQPTKPMLISSTYCAPNELNF